VFKEAGFVQLLHQTPPDRAQERAVRIFVDYASITSVTGEPYFDLQFLRERFRIAVKGSFQRWEAPVHGSRGLPALGCEPWAIPIESLSLSLDDPVTAKRLMDALWLLSGR
ncbi:MAG TPA: hypothetical protein VKU80_09455, partial [Planctomycetota bacterium]|nr:hypothetical protein [Planctomycetota bacterium]